MGVREAIDAYNKSLKENEDGTRSVSKETKQLTESISKNNSSFGEYLTGLKGAKAGFGRYAASLATATLKTIGLEVATTAMNMTISMGVSAVINSLLSGIVYLATYESRQKEAFENAKQAAKETSQTIRDLKSEMSDTSTKASELSSEFAQLVQGVNPLTNENQSLSTERYERFLEINNELAELFPSLTHNYDENGNAILGLSGDVDTVTASIQRLVEQQNNLAKADIRKHLEDYVNGTEDNDGVFKALEGYETEVTEAKKKLDSLENTYNSIINKSGGKYFGQDALGYNNYLDDIKNKLGQEAYDALYNATTQDNGGVNGATTYSIDFSKLELDETTKGRITESYNTFYQDLQTDLSVKQSELETQNREMSDMMMVWVEDIDLYKSSDNESFKKAIQSMVGSIKWSDLDVEEGNLEEAKSFIQSTIITPLSVACNDPNSTLQITNALNNLFSFDFSKLNYKEANEKIKGFLNDILLVFNKGKDKSEQKSLVDMYDMFGLGDYDKATVKMKKNLTGIANGDSDDYNRLTNYTKDFNQEQVEAWLKVTEGDRNAEQAIQRYEQSLNSANKNIPKTFKQAWESLGTTGTDEEKKAAQEAKDKLLELAEAGKLTEKALKESSLADTFREAGVSIEEATEKINKMKSSADQLASMKTGISSISSILGQKEENQSSKETRNKGISADTLAGMPENVKAQTDEYEHFVEVLGKGTSKMKDCKDAANKLATAYVNSSNFLAKLTPETKDYYTSVLKEMGVENAAEVVKNTLTKQTYALRLEKLINANASSEEIEALQKEAEQYGITSAEMANYVLQKEISNNNALDTSKSIKSLIKLANQCGATGKVVVALRDLLKETSKLEDIENDNLSNYTASIQTDARHAVDEAYNAKGNAHGKQAEKVSKLNRKLQKLLKKGKTALKVDVEPSNKDGSSSKKSKDSTKESKQTIDWIERRLNNLQSTIDLTSAKLQNLFSVKSKNKNLDKQIKTTTKLIKEYGIAASKYQDKADSIASGSGYKKTVKSKNGKKKKVKQKLSKSIIKKIQTGKLTKKTKLSSLIKAYGSDKAEQIQSYIDYYDKAQSAKKSQAEQTTKKRELQQQKYQNYVDLYDSRTSRAEAKEAIAVGSKAKNTSVNTQIKNLQKSYQYQIKIAKLTKNKAEAERLEYELQKKITDLKVQQIENIQKDYENQIGLIDNKEQDVKNQVSLMEAKGQIVTAGYYNSQTNYEKQKRNKTIEERNAVQNSLNAAIKDGTIKVYSDEWYDIQSKLQTLDNTINDCDTNIIENTKKLVELHDAMVDAIAENNSNMQGEGDFLAGLMGNNLTDSDIGTLTREGKAVLGTYGIGMETNESNARKYKAEVDRIQKLRDKNTKGEYASIEERDKVYEEYYKKWQESIQSVYDYESKIIDLITEKYQAQLDYMKKIIDAKKEALSTEKD